MYCIKCKTTNKDGLSICSRCGNQLKPLVSLDNLSYGSVSMSFVQGINDGNPGFVFKSDKRKFLELIENGDVRMVTLTVESFIDIDENSAEDLMPSYHSYIFAQTESGLPLDHAVRSVSNSRPNVGEQIIILQIKRKKDFKYCALDNDSYDYVKSNILSLVGYKYNETKPRPKRGIFDNTRDAVSGIIGGIFGKK